MKSYNTYYKEGINCGGEDIHKISDAGLKKIIGDVDKWEIDEPIEQILHSFGASKKTIDRISKYDQEIVGKYNSEIPDELIEKFEMAAENFYKGWIKGVYIALSKTRKLPKFNKHIDINNLMLTRHSEIRMQQRGITSSHIVIGLKYGTEKNTRDGATKIFFGNKERQVMVSEKKREIQDSDKAKNLTIIIGSNSMITVYKDNGAKKR